MPRRATRWRPGRALPDPGPVLLMGSRVVWSEATRPHESRRRHGGSCDCGCRDQRDGEDGDPSTRVVTSRASCPNGCGRRDLAKERRYGLDRTCLRCFTATWDPPGYQLPLSVKPSPPSQPKQTRSRRKVRAFLFERPVDPRTIVYD